MHHHNLNKHGQIWTKTWLQSSASNCIKFTALTDTSSLATSQLSHTQHHSQHHITDLSDTTSLPTLHHSLHRYITPNITALSDTSLLTSHHSSLRHNITGQLSQTHHSQHLITAPADTTSLLTSRHSSHRYITPTITALSDTAGLPAFSSPAVVALKPGMNPWYNLGSYHQFLMVALYFHAMLLTRKPSPCGWQISSALSPKPHHSCIHYMAC